jgi:cell division protein FtsI/penicillin-binding protein 2
MEAILSWILRAIVLAIGAGMLVLLVRWLAHARRTTEERWPLRLAFGMLALALLYAIGHGRMLLSAEAIEAGRMRYVRFGDPRRAELRRAEVRGWILDCTSSPENALARYAATDGVVDRVYPLGPAGANLVGGGEDADLRDYTIERLYAEQLRRAVSLGEAGELHPAGTDISLTLCRGATARAWELLQQTGRRGAVVVQDVRTGALVAYASTGGPDEPPLGLQEYAAPGSIWKLALAAVWWENGVPDQDMGCQSEIQVTPRAVIHNSEGFSIPRVNAPTEMLVYSCNTTAVRMALDLRERLGESAFQDAYRNFGVVPYAAGEAPGGFQLDFWRTESDAWRRRMSPPPARVRLSAESSTQEWAQLAIGQGPIDVTPIHVSRFVSAIGNGGVMVDATIEGELAREAPDGRRIMSQETAGKLLAAMMRVVDHGTARSTAPVLQGLTWDMAGKTGTAQVARADDNGWFAGLILDPEGRPRYSVVAFLIGGGPGGRMPAGIGAGMTRYFATQAGGVVEEAE